LTAQFVDISSFQGTIDFGVYSIWARQWDGVARIAIKATEGVGFTDPRFLANRAGALAAGIDTIIFYHFGRPDLGNSAVDEANWFRSVVGDVRGSDVVILDYEVEAPQANSDWAYTWLIQQQSNYRGKPPGIYASLSYIETRLQDQRLSAFPLWLADWTFDPGARPAAPAPWGSYAALQYTDSATNIPGIAGPVDANIFLGGFPMSAVPQGWSDDGQTLTAPNGHKVRLGFREYVLNHTWNPENQPQEEEHGANPAQLHRPDLGAGTRQVFRDGVFWWTGATGVINEAYLGLELDAAYQALAASQAQTPQS
jgi:GH25 family lysozyme M1 (1,4-beta-N-acetylmuramidase)